MKHIAVILAGGIGSRIGGGVPKQLLPLEDGKSILAHAVEAFEMAKEIVEVLIVMHKDYVSDVLKIVEKEGWKKVKAVIEGGKERWESSVKAIEYCKERLSQEEIVEYNILLHDAARPFVSQEIITRVCNGLKESEAVTVAVPSTDTMYVVRREEEKVELQSIPNRSCLMRAQTPQAFRLALIDEAYKRALQDENLQATDDCGIVNKYMPKVAIAIVEGEEKNKKITYKEDL